MTGDGAELVAGVQALSRHWADSWLAAGAPHADSPERFPWEPPADAAAGLVRMFRAHLQRSVVRVTRDQETGATVLWFEPRHPPDPADLIV